MVKLAKSDITQEMVSGKVFAYALLEFCIK